MPGKATIPLRSFAGRPAIFLAVGLAVAVLGAFAAKGLPLLHRALRHGAESPIVDMPSVRGTLRVSIFGDAPTGLSPLTPHETAWVNGPDYQGMEDNDLRGYLDGTFFHPWNQTTQVHVRIGRRDTTPRYGEYELFRVLQRWEGVALPPGARVLDAALRLGIEGGAPDTVRLMLYAVNKDWNPGGGGTLGDNVSPPRPGEVWWNDRAYRQAPWGLPGVGFASATDPRADTGAMPLAEALVPPGAGEVELASATLAAYATGRIAARAPLLFLLKLADYQEDMPGSIITVYSGNHGDSRNVARRPRLVLSWESPCEAETILSPIFLEYGRGIDLPEISVDGPRWIAATFEPEKGFPVPTLEIRTVPSAAPEGEGGSWRILRLPMLCGPGAVMGRALAAVDPIALGEPFTAELRDTWIRTAPPEEQKVPWVFVSPTGIRHEVSAAYQGEHRWSVRFEPDEIGAWRYSWRQSFIEEPYQSPIGRFDVLARDLTGVRRGLKQLADEAREADRRDRALQLSLMIRLDRLERAFLQLQTAESFAAEGPDVRRELNEVRATLGEAAPDSLPMAADKPPAWKRNPRGNGS